MVLLVLLPLVCLMLIILLSLILLLSSILLLSLELLLPLQQINEEQQSYNTFLSLFFISQYLSRFPGLSSAYESSQICVCALRFSLEYPTIFKGGRGLYSLYIGIILITKGPDPRKGSELSYDDKCSKLVLEIILLVQALRRRVYRNKKVNLQCSDIWKMKDADMFYFLKRATPQCP